jgi:hypothetical protein
MQTGIDKSSKFITSTSNLIQGQKKQKIITICLPFYTGDMGAQTFWQWSDDIKPKDDITPFDGNRLDNFMFITWKNSVNLMLVKNKTAPSIMYYTFPLSGHNHGRIRFRIRVTALKILLNLKILLGIPTDPVGRNPVACCTWSDWDLNLCLDNECKRYSKETRSRDRFFTKINCSKFK